MLVFCLIFARFFACGSCTRGRLSDEDDTSAYRHTTMDQSAGEVPGSPYASFSRGGGPRSMFSLYPENIARDTVRLADSDCHRVRAWGGRNRPV